MVAIGWKFKTGWSDITIATIATTFAYLIIFTFVTFAHCTNGTFQPLPFVRLLQSTVFQSPSSFLQNLSLHRPTHCQWQFVIHSTVLRNSCRQYCIWSLQRHICDWPIWWSNPILIVATTHCHSFNCSVSSAGAKVPPKIHAVSKYWPRLQIYTFNRSANTFHPSFVIHNISYFATSSL